jgi:endonuclease/exonuclease/phosphatase family metal-dependent hydrolase
MSFNLPVINEEYFYAWIKISCMIKGKLTQRLILTIPLLFLNLYQLKPNEYGSLKQIIPQRIHELKIISWNIYMLPHCSWVNGNCKRARTIAQKISLSNYDIILFQEAFDYRARDILKKGLRSLFPYIYGPANKSFFSLRINSGIWILSKIPLHKLEEISFKCRFGIDALARKGAVLYEGEWQGQLFQLACTHLQANSPDSIRREQCQEIADRLLKKYSEDNIPQIICGDFNIEIDDADNYRHMLSILKSKNGNIESDVQSSFDEIDNKLARRKDGKKRLIDYVLVRNMKFIKDVSRRISVYKGIQKSISFDLSDHYGIEACINFNPSKKN